MFTSALGDSVDELSKTVPLGRIGTPEDVAFLVAFLLGDESKYISATIISVDGVVRG
jgi:NAD(P)-dependent dehydrogenase (short-subunit alcohol dehydrogenase family)